MADIYLHGVTRRRVSDLKVGDHVDLQNDQFADPDGYEQNEHVENGESPACRANGWAFEFAVVQEITLEPHDTDPCVVLDFGNCCFGFPPDHLIAVDGEQER